MNGEIILYLLWVASVSNFLFPFENLNPFILWSILIYFLNFVLRAKILLSFCEFLSIYFWVSSLFMILNFTTIIEILHTSCYYHTFISSSLKLEWIFILIIIYFRFLFITFFDCIIYWYSFITLLPRSIF